MHALKLCECGCGEPTPIASQTRSAWGYRKGEHVRFIQGHYARLHPMRGADSPGWRGDAAGYQAVHVWLRRNHPKTSVCEECGAETDTDYAFKRHPEPYTRNIEDYRELCRGCHRAFDRLPNQRRAA